MTSNQFGRNYLKNKKLFLNFFFDFRNVHEILNICKKKMTFIPDLFPKLRTPKNVVRYIFKKSCFKGTFDWQHGKQCDLNHSTVTNLVIILKVISEKVYFNQMQSLISVFDQYSLLNRHSLTQPIFEMYMKF